MPDNLDELESIGKICPNCGKNADFEGDYFHCPWCNSIIDIVWHEEESDEDEWD